MDPIGGQQLKAIQKGGANRRDGQRTFAKAPGALQRLIYMGIPHINWPWKGSWSLGKDPLPIPPVSSPLLFCLKLGINSLLYEHVGSH